MVFVLEKCAERLELFIHTGDFIDVVSLNLQRGYRRFLKGGFTEQYYTEQYSATMTICSLN